MLCFLCKAEVSAAKEYAYHLKYVHRNPFVKVYDCIESTCGGRAFRSWKSLRQHLNAKHSEATSNQPANLARTEPVFINTDFLEQNNSDSDRNDAILPKVDNSEVV